ncbi:lytic transglycosylase domain-containing protein [Flavobacterium oreochromis]|uniref:Murein transglycosylase n=2 Tax=Flavobacterium TaxID=237 RepID=A0A246GD75_9FLAO|nr:lytic transglycosylase domain-containing protein [Flavobacterium oreochromis]OWP77004.1 murein transglycosylase [Flavobacterium oreochromis]OWP77845.1 murein transglycosylase [Flavobacterium oreochromis]POR28838.1 murein transglycosylase [Flavobacterium columnare]QYS85467.1 lytic transglycosylase domain-containing protein [Flavobacterium oreochromis]
MKFRSIVFLFLSVSFILVSWKSNPLFPVKIDFCGEEVPLDVPDVHERLDRELIINEYMHGSTIMIIKRAYRFFPIIEPILVKNNVPDDFKYLAVIESSLTNATSPSGAKGFWQFMPQTAKEKGMEITDGIDERYHLEKATQAACEYLLKAKEKFGSWTLAAASYNGGMNGLQKAINQQLVSNYYDLLLTDETFRYVFRILALKEIMKNPKQYGFELKETELYKPLKVKKIEVDSSITDLAKFAKNQGVNYKELKLMNPWLRDVKLDNPNKKKYILDLPVK